MTRAELIAEAAASLRDAGVESPRTDASTLLRHVLGVSRLELAARPDLETSSASITRFRRLVDRRIRREPLPYILGQWPFFDFGLAVGPAVLIPRPETELLVDTVIAIAATVPLTLIVDVGVGAGAIAIALARALPDAALLGVDRSLSSLEVAAENVSRLGLTSRITLIHGDLLAPLPADLTGRVDAIVSNPPYIPSGQIDTLQPEVARYEPRVALDGGPDGLDVIRRLSSTASSWLKPGGLIALEIGAGQEESVHKLLKGEEYSNVGSRLDLSGIPRVITARAPDVPPARSIGE